MNAQDRAIETAQRFRSAGFEIAKVIIDGKRVEVIMKGADEADPFDLVDLRRKK